MSKEGRLEEAIADYKELIKKNSTKEFIQELSALQRKVKEQEATQVKKESPLIEEVSSPEYTGEFKTEPEPKAAPVRKNY